jgi:hypothetical protein
VSLPKIENRNKMKKKSGQLGGDVCGRQVLILTVHRFKGSRHSVPTVRGKMQSRAAEGCTGVSREEDDGVKKTSLTI